MATNSPILVSAARWQGRFTLFSSDGVGITLDSLLYGVGWRRYYVGLIVIWSLYWWTLQSWSQQHNDRDGSPLLSSASDGAGITLNPLLYGTYRNSDGLSNPGLSSTTTGTVLHFSPRPQMAQALRWTHCYMELIGIAMGSPTLVWAAQRWGLF